MTYSVMKPLLSLVLLATLVVAPGPNIVPLTPNDPGTRDNLLNIHDLRNGFGWQDWLENQPPTSGIEDTVAVILDTQNNCGSIADLRDQCLSQLSKNFTDEDPSLDNNLHGAQVASAFLAVVNNAASALGTAGYKGHIKFVPDKAARSDGSLNSNWLRAGYQHALDLRTLNHLNVRWVIVSSVTIGDSNQAESLRLIRLLAGQGIMVFAAAGFNGVNLDDVAVKFYPAAYAATETNVIAVGATDSTGTALDPNSPFGSMVQYAGLGLNVQVVNPHDNSNISTASMSGTSVANPLVAGIWAITYAYRFHHMSKVRRRIQRSCNPIPKVKCGVPRLGEALKDIPVSLLLGSDGKAIVMESVTQRVGPFARDIWQNFSVDHKNRLMLFAENVDEPLSPSELTVTLEDSTHATFAGIVEYVAEIPGQEWVTQVNVVLPSGIAPGQVKVTLFTRGASSSTTISVS